jgi:formaldehyde-activating enzyme involved in methanogenesis
MGRKGSIYCEVCGGTMPSGAADLLVFHCLAFCSPDCLDDYKAHDEQRRAAKDATSRTHATAPKRSRAA